MFVGPSIGKKRSPTSKLAESFRINGLMDEAAYKRHLETLKHLNQHNINLQKLRQLRGLNESGLEGGHYNTYAKDRQKYLKTPPKGIFKLQELSGESAPETRVISPSSKNEIHHGRRKSEFGHYRKISNMMGGIALEDTLKKHAGGRKLNLRMIQTNTS